MMIEVNVYEYLLLFIFAVIGGCMIGKRVGLWLGRQLARAYIYIFGVHFTLKMTNGERGKILVRGKDGVKLADAAALAKAGE